MSPVATSVLETALSLPESERAAIADALFSSRADENEEFVEMSDEEFSNELQRRSEEMQKDPTARIPWSEVKDMP